MRPIDVQTAQQDAMFGLQILAKVILEADFSDFHRGLQLNQ